MSDVTLAGNSEAIETFVRELYRKFLGREADAGGLEHYVSELQNGRSPSLVLDAFLSGDEAVAYRRRRAFAELPSAVQGGMRSAAQPEGEMIEPSELFPADYVPPGEAGRCYAERRANGFLQRYCSGPVVLDVGFSGYDNPERKAALPHAIGIDLDYPGYDGTTLPFADGSVDTVFSSHCLEHILFDIAVIRDWFRVLRVGGFIVCMVPSMALYEKRRFPPSRFNADHKRMYTPSLLAKSFEDALETNSYRVRHLRENDRGFDYTLGPETHSDGSYEIEIVVEKIWPPNWRVE